MPRCKLDVIGRARLAVSLAQSAERFAAATARATDYETAAKQSREAIELITAARQEEAKHWERTTRELRNILKKSEKMAEQMRSIENARPF